MSKPIKVLYAEDDQNLREVITELLESEGIQCVPAVDGIDASEKIPKENFDVIITDFRMPRMDGADLLLWCRKNKIHTPFIFMSANVERIPKEVMALGDCCASYLSKPVEFDQLLKAINDALSRTHEFDCHGETVDEVVDGVEFKGKHVLA